MHIALSYQWFALSCVYVFPMSNNFAFVNLRQYILWIVSCAFRVHLQKSSNIETTVK